MGWETQWMIGQIGKRQTAAENRLRQTIRELEAELDAVSYASSENYRIANKIKGQRNKLREQVASLEKQLAAAHEQRDRDITKINQRGARFGAWARVSRGIVDHLMAMANERAGDRGPIFDDKEIEEINTYLIHRAEARFVKTLLEWGESTLDFESDRAPNPLVTPDMLRERTRK